MFRRKSSRKPPKKKGTSAPPGNAEVEEAAESVYGMTTGTSGAQAPSLSGAQAQSLFRRQSKRDRKKDKKKKEKGAASTEDSSGTSGLATSTASSSSSASGKGGGSSQADLKDMSLFKVKYLGALPVASGAGDHVVAAAVTKVREEKREPIKAFIILRSDTLIVATRKTGEVLQNLDIACITFTSVNPADPKQFAFISQARTGVFFCHIFHSKDKVADAPRAISEAMEEYKKAVAELLKGSMRKGNTGGAGGGAGAGAGGSSSSSSNQAQGPFLQNPSASQQQQQQQQQQSASVRRPNQQPSIRGGPLPVTSQSVRGPQPGQQQQQREPLSRRRTGSVSGASMRLRSRSGSLSARVGAEASAQPLPVEGATHLAVYLGYEMVSHLAGKMVCMTAVKRNAERWAGIKQKRQHADGKGVSLQVTNYAIKTVDKRSEEPVFADFIKNVSFTCVARKTQAYEIFTYISHDERLKRTICHIYRVTPSTGDAICSSIAKAFSYIADLERQRGSNPFAVTDSRREPVKGELFQHQIHRAHLTAGKHIGGGQFGDVYLATQLVKEGMGDKGGNTVQRAVKMLRNAAVEADKQEFLHEASVMLELTGDHLVQFVGVSLQQKPWLCVLEFMEYGDLKTVLLTCKEKQLQLTLQEILRWCFQLSDGMAFMATKRLVHMDLAARNCMLTHNNLVKVGDFGLTQRLDDGEDHFVLRKRLKLPLKWVAIEGLEQKIFSEFSDCWSFGVLMWEIFTYGEIPYPDVEVKDIFQRVRQGLRLSQPPNCPDRMYSIMAKCWKRDRRTRWSFSALRRMLENEMRYAPTAALRDIGATIHDLHGETIDDNIDPNDDAEGSLSRTQSQSMTSPQPQPALRQASTRARSISAKEPAASMLSATQTESTTDSVTLGRVPLDSTTDTPPPRPPKPAGPQRAVSIPPHGHSTPQPQQVPPGAGDEARPPPRPSKPKPAALQPPSQQQQQQHQHQPAMAGAGQRESPPPPPVPSKPKPGHLLREVTSSAQPSAAALAPPSDAPPPRPSKPKPTNLVPTTAATPGTPPAAATATPQQQQQQQQHQLAGGAGNRSERAVVLARRRAQERELEARAEHLKISDDAERKVTTKKGMAGMLQVDQQQQHSRIYQALNPKPLWFQSAREREELEDEKVDVGLVVYDEDLTPSHDADVTADGSGGFGFDDDDEEDEDEEDEDNYDPDNLPDFGDVADVLRQRRAERAQQEEERRKELMLQHQREKQQEQQRLERELETIREKEARENAARLAEEKRVLGEAQKRAEAELTFNFTFN